MPVLKVWDVERNKKKTVLASSIAELLSKGKEKLGLKGHVRAVIEADGTDVDDDDVLRELQACTMILLEEDQCWKEASHSDTEQNEPTPTKLVDPPPTKVIEEESVQSKPNYSVLFNKDVPLPGFSNRVEAKLKAGLKQTFQCWHEIIYETALFYYNKYPDIGVSSDYQKIGMKMYSCYPYLEREGVHPWSVFVTTLSQRIRHIRWNETRKTRPQEGSEKKSFNLPTRGLHTKPPSSEEDYKKNLTELRKEWGKPVKNRSEAHLKELLRETFSGTQAMIQEEPDGKLSTIVKQVPCYQEATYLLYDFCQLLGKEKWGKMKKTMPIFVEAVLGLCEEESESDKKEGDQMLKIIHLIEQETSMKGTAKNSIVTLKKNVPDDEMEEALKTRETEAPRIIAFTDEEDQPKGCFVVGDGMVIDCQSNDGGVAALVLMGVYYVFHLEYPLVYSQVLGILQTYFIKTLPYHGKRSKKYHHFSTILKKEMFGK